jgi:hypothetical protein
LATEGRLGEPYVDMGKEEKVAGEVEGVGSGEGGGQVGQFREKPLAGVYYRVRIGGRLVGVGAGAGESGWVIATGKRSW